MRAKPGAPMIDSTAPRYSLVIPVFNEEAVLPLLLRRLDELLLKLDAPAEVIFVDDGSRDTTPIYLRARAKDDSRFRYIGFSRNFGHQIAITAGLDAARGSAVIVMDADLQDPPEVVLDMIGQWKAGYEIVHARRIRRDADSLFKRTSAAAFYRLLRMLSSVPMPENVGDFRLIDRKVVDAFRAMPERVRYVRGMFAWLGFRHTFVDFERPARAAGETHYPLWKMLRLAVAGLVGFSDVPLRMVIWAGLAVSFSAVCYGLYALGLKAFGGHVIEGWTSMMVVVSFLCGANMLMTGIIGLYVGRIHAEVKERPLYVVSVREGFGERLAASPVREVAA